MGQCGVGDSLTLSSRRNAIRMQRQCSSHSSTQPIICRQKCLSSAFCLMCPLVITVVQLLRMVAAVTYNADDRSIKGHVAKAV